MWNSTVWPLPVGFMVAAVVGLWLARIVWSRRAVTIPRAIAIAAISGVCWILVTVPGVALVLGMFDAGTAASAWPVRLIGLVMSTGFAALVFGLATLNVAVWRRTGSGE
jgi:hypothetical protein